MEDTVVIVGAARTPIGSFNGSLSSLPATQLGKVAVEEALKRANVKPADVSEVYLGQVYTAGNYFSIAYPYICDTSISLVTNHLQY